MNSIEAKEVLAVYLVGGRVSKSALEAALRLIRENDPVRRALAEALTSDEPDCEMFRHNLEEFSEMSREEREDEMPGLPAHLELCPSCRWEYWEIKPLWQPVELDFVKQYGQEIRKQLSEGIRLTISESGWLRDKGWGPFPVRFTSDVLLEPETESLPSPDEIKRMEWTLRDESEHCLIRMIIEGLSSWKGALRCVLEGDRASTIDVSQARIEALQAVGRRTVFADQLSRLPLNPLHLPTGSWIIKVKTLRGVNLLCWEIPLSLEAGGTQQQA